MASRPSPKALMILGAVLAAAAMVGAFKIITDSASQGRGWGHHPTPVGIATAHPAPFVEKINAIGTAHSNQSVELTAKVTETVRSISFDDGDSVEKGQILVELTNAEDTAALHAAETALAEAKKNYQRFANLVKSGSATKASLDQAKTTLGNAQSQVDQIEARLADRLIRAPFSGVLGLRQVSEGSLVKPGDVITTIDDVSVMKLDFTVPETYLGTLKVGLKVDAKTPAYPGKTFKGTVSAIDPRIDPVTRAVKVRAIIPNPDKLLKPGLLMTVQLIRDTKTALAIPQRAVVVQGDDSFVYRITGDTVERVSISTGSREGDLVEITHGLKAGDRIVADGTHRVTPGGKVNIVEIDGKPVTPPARKPET